MVLQKTLNEHVNSEAVEAWVDVLPKVAERIEWNAWPNDPTTAEAEALQAFREAEGSMRAALGLARKARRLADDIAYERLYGRLRAE